MRSKFVAVDDPELNSWLLELIADPSPSFLSALAEAVVAANLEGYAVVRPSLIRLREKYQRETPGKCIGYLPFHPGAIHA